MITDAQQSRLDALTAKVLATSDGRELLELMARLCVVIEPEAALASIARERRRWSTGGPLGLPSAVPPDP